MCTIRSSSIIADPTSFSFLWSPSKCVIQALGSWSLFFSLHTWNSLCSSIFLVVIFGAYLFLSLVQATAVSLSGRSLLRTLPVTIWKATHPLLVFIWIDSSISSYAYYLFASQFCFSIFPTGVFLSMTCNVGGDLAVPFRIPAKPFLWPLAKNLTSQSDHDETDPSKAMIWIVLFSLMVFFLYLWQESHGNRQLLCEFSWFCSHPVGPFPWDQEWMHHPLPWQTILWPHISPWHHSPSAMLYFTNDGSYLQQCWATSPLKDHIII